MSALSRALYTNVVRRLPKSAVSEGARHRLQIFGRKSYARAVRLCGEGIDRVVKRDCPVTFQSNGKEMTLEGTLLSPAKRASEALPVILIRTPYRRVNAFNLGWVYAERGYHVLVQDTRGRFGSSGEFFPVANEVEDGRATVQWLKAQNFCKNGKIGCLGISYLGLTAYAAASFDDTKESSGGVTCLVPCLSSSRLFPIFKAPHGGGLALDLGLRWLYIVLNLQLRASGFVEFLYRLLISAPQLDNALLHVPLQEADAMVTGSGEHVAFFQDALNNLNGDEPFWKDKDVLFDLAKHQVPPIHTPVLHASALALFQRHLKDEMQDVSDEEDFPVKVKVIKSGKWFRFKRWPPPNAHSQVWYLDCNSARLVTSAPEHGSVDYTYNPEDPTPFVGGTSFNPSNSGPKDQNHFESRKDVAVFTSDILPSPLRVVGTIIADIIVSCSIPHLDIVVRLCDVLPNGTSINVCDGMMRQRDDSCKFQFCFNVASTAYEFKSGNRLRIQICSGAHPKWLRNYGTNDAVASAVNMLPARVSLLAPSSITLPILPLDAKQHPHHRM